MATTSNQATPLDPLWNLVFPDDYYSDDYSDDGMETSRTSTVTTSDVLSSISPKREVRFTPPKPQQQQPRRQPVFDRYESDDESDGDDEGNSEGFLDFLGEIDLDDSTCSERGTSQESKQRGRKLGRSARKYRGRRDDSRDDQESYAKWSLSKNGKERMSRSRLSQQEQEQPQDEVPSETSFLDFMDLTSFFIDANNDSEQKETSKPLEEYSERRKVSTRSGGEATIPEGLPKPAGHDAAPSKDIPRLQKSKRDQERDQRMSALGRWRSQRQSRRPNQNKPPKQNNAAPSAPIENEHPKKPFQERTPNEEVVTVVLKHKLREDNPQPKKSPSRSVTDEIYALGDESTQSLNSFSTGRSSPIENEEFDSKAWKKLLHQNDCDDDTMPESVNNEFPFPSTVPVEPPQTPNRFSRRRFRQDPFIDENGRIKLICCSVKPAFEEQHQEELITHESAHLEAPVEEKRTNFLCRSQAEPEFDSEERRSTLLCRSHVEEPAFPDIRAVPDDESSFISRTHGEQDSVNVSQQSSVDGILALLGPQTLYTYEYEQGHHMELRYDDFGFDARDVMDLREIANPHFLRKAPNDAVVMIEASTVSVTDCTIRRGEWFAEDNLALPIVPGVDFVGRVKSINGRSSSFRHHLRNGDRVISLIKTGGNARYTRIHPDQLVKVPEHVDPAEAACLAETYLAAFQVVHYSQKAPMRYRKKALQGKSILVLGALTNVGRAAVELANRAGATFVYACGKEKHRERIRAIGATPLGRKVDEWMPYLAGKLDLIIDATMDSFRENLSTLGALGVEGHYVFVGKRMDFVDEVLANRGPSILMCSRKRAQTSGRILAYEVFHSWEKNLDESKRDLAHLVTLLAKKEIKPQVLDRIPLNRVVKAQEIAETNQLRGFIVCEPWIKSMQRALYM